MRTGREPIVSALAFSVLALAGCHNPDAASTAHTNERASVQNVGEPATPAAPAPGTQAPAHVEPTPNAAISAFARLYVNWSFRTLAEHQRALAAMAVGAARLSEQQAGASAAHDEALARGHIYNRWQVVDVAPDALRSGWWAIVTREQTGGNAQYEGLRPAYHVTIAKLASVAGGYAVEQWLPQS
jgi:hypothetical protein